MADANHLGVSPDMLRSVSPQFRVASQDTLDMVNQLDWITRNLLNDMYSANLVHAPDALDALWRRWFDALNTLSGAMQTVADNLDAAANVYQITDNNAMH